MRWTVLGTGAVALGALVPRLSAGWAVLAALGLALLVASVLRRWTWTGAAFAAVVIAAAALTDRRPGLVALAGAALGCYLVVLDLGGALQTWAGVAAWLRLHRWAAPAVVAGAAAPLAATVLPVVAVPAVVVGAAGAAALLVWWSVPWRQ